MSKILITGNGFDLYHGLPTTYSNFIETLSKIEKSKSIKTDYLHYFKSNDSFNAIEFNETKIQEIKNGLNNKWYLFFRDELKFDTWIDFESKLEDTLKVIWNFINFVENNVFHDKNIDEHYTLYFYNVDVFKFQKVRILFHFEIISRNGVSLDSFLFNKKYTEFVDRKFTNLKEIEISKMLLKELGSFIDIFDLYFQTFVVPIIDFLRVSMKYEKLVGVNKYFTFNYTNSFDLLYKDESTTVEHLHGRIGVGSEKNNMVLGFNDIEDIITNKKFYIPFTKYFQTLEKETDYKFLKDIDSFSGRFKFTTIYLWGHSLDVSDKIYFDEIIGLLKENKNYILKIFYHNSEAKFKMLVNLIGMIGQALITELMKKDQIQFLILNDENINLELRSYSKFRDVFI